MTRTDPEEMASRLSTGLAARGIALPPDTVRQLVADQLGFDDWDTCTTADASAPVDHPAPRTIPLLRTFPGREAHRFYVDFLGFTVDWEHRFGDDMPLYQQVSRDGCVLHLSEHHGDATPGSAVRIEIADVRALQRELAASQVYPLRIGLSREPWGDDLELPDPFGNRLVFHTPGRNRAEAQPGA